MLQIIGLVWPALVIGSLGIVTATVAESRHSDTEQHYAGFVREGASAVGGGAQTASIASAGVEAGLSALSAASVASEKPITLPAPSQLPPPVHHAPSGRNIISNVYFPIEKLNKNLISTNDSPTNGSGDGGNSSSGSGSSNTNNNNNNNLRRRSQGQKLAGLNDLRPDSDLINSAGTEQPVKWPSKAATAKEREATNVTAQLNNHAYLVCKLNRTLLQISQVSNKSVSWVRMRDDHILTVNRVTFIADERFHSFYDATNGVWTLQVKYVGEQDNGYYECQVGTEPKLSAQILLNVIVPRTEIAGDRIRYVKGGSNVVLRCIVRDAIEPPIYISWFYNGHQIYNENTHGWKMAFERNILTGTDGASQGLSTSSSSSSESGGDSISPLVSATSPSFYQRPATNIRFKSIGSLIIPSVRKRDTGNYTCSPSNSGSVSVMLHVIHGDYSASAITSSSSRGRFSDLITIIISVAMLNAT